MRLSRKRHVSGDPDEYTSGYGVKALSYCDMHTITLANLMAVLDDYPKFADEFLRQFVVTFSIQREVRSLCNYIGYCNFRNGLARVYSKLHGLRSSFLVIVPLACIYFAYSFVSDIAVFVLKRDVKLQLTNFAYSCLLFSSYT